MNEDYIWEYFKDQAYEKQYVLDAYRQFEREAKMPYYYDRYDDRSRGDEVATATLKAFAAGISFDTLLKKNSRVRAYWGQVQADEVAAAKAAEKERARLDKLAAARAAKQAAKEEVMTKLTQEELEAFGLVKKKRVTKR